MTKPHKMFAAKDLWFLYFLALSHDCFIFLALSDWLSYKPFWALFDLLALANLSFWHFLTFLALSDWLTFLSLFDLFGILQLTYLFGTFWPFYHSLTCLSFKTLFDFLALFDWLVVFVPFWHSLTHLSFGTFWLMITCGFCNFFALFDLLWPVFVNFGLLKANTFWLIVVSITLWLIVTFWVQNIFVTFWTYCGELSYCTFLTYYGQVDWLTVTFWLPFSAAATYINLFCSSHLH